jgi:hypothetical protein
VVGREPPVVAVVRGKPVQQVQQVQQRALLPGAAGTADQAVGERGRAEHDCVARPGVQMCGQRGERGLGVARHEQAEERDVAGFARGQASGERVGRRHRLARRRGVAAFQQRVRLGGMRKRKARIGGDGTIERLDRAGVHSELGLSALYVGVPRSG